jgi:hypothetical protein
MRAVRAKLCALLAALLLLLPGGVPVQARYYCQMTKQVVAACCCGAEIAARAANRTAGTKVTAQQCRVADCCQRLSSSSAATSPATQQAFDHVATAPLSFTLPNEPRVFADGQARDACAESTQAPHSIGPPLFVQHCAFLS